MSGGECKCKCIAWICLEKVQFLDCFFLGAKCLSSVPNFPNWKAMRPFQFCKCKKVALSFRLKLPPSANLAGCPNSATLPNLTEKRHVRLNDLKRKKGNLFLLNLAYGSITLHSWWSVLVGPTMYWRIKSPDARIAVLRTEFDVMIIEHNSSAE